jgi:ribosomal protein S18 acetylase RimI-like enzyme
VELSEYRDADLAGLVAAVAGWISVAGRCGYDHPGELPHRIYDNLRGRPGLMHVFHDGPRLAGITLAHRFGAAFDALVAPELRGTGAELAMLRHAAEVTDRAMGPAGGPHLLTDVFDADTTRRRLLADLGYRPFRTWDHVTERPLTELPDPGAPAGGFVVRVARMGDADGLAAARNECFGGGWTGGEYRAVVMERAGYRFGRELVAVAPDGRIGAFLVYWADAVNRIGHLEPVGTGAGFRRRGLAGLLVRRALAELAAAGMTLATVNHAADNEPAGRLYASLGFTTRYRTLGYRRPR